MSGVFDKFMSSYVLLERRNLEELLQKLSQVGKERSSILSPLYSFFMSFSLLVYSILLFLFFVDSFSSSFFITLFPPFLFSFFLSFLHSFFPSSLLLLFEWKGGGHSKQQRCRGSRQSLQLRQCYVCFHQKLNQTMYSTIERTGIIMYCTALHCTAL